MAGRYWIQTKIDEDGEDIKEDEEWKMDGREKMWVEGDG